MVQIVKKTVGAVADYSTLDLWETGQAKNCVTADVIERAALLNEVHTVAFSINSGAWLTDGSHYIWVSAEDGAEHNGIQGKGARFEEGAGTHVMTISTATPQFVKYSGFEITTATPTAHQVAFFCGVAQDTIVFDRMIVHDFTTGNGRGAWFNGVAIPHFYVTNSLYYDLSFRGMSVLGTTVDQTLRMYNCTFDRTAIAVEIDNFTSTKDFDIRNNVMEGGPALLNSRGDNAGWNALCNKNITDDASPTTTGLPGAFIESATFQTGTGGSGTRVMFDSFVPGSENYRLSATSDDNSAQDYGDNLTNLAVPLDVDLTVDIAGKPRPATGAWDAGAFQTTAPEVNSSTVGTASDYATLELFEAGEAGSLFPDNVIVRAQMKDEIHTSAVNLNSSSWETDALRYIWIDGDTSNRHNGTANSGARIIDNAGAHVIQLSQAEHLHVTWLELSTSTPASGQVAIFPSVSGTTIHCDKVIAHGFTAANGRGFWFANVGGSLTFINGVMYNIERAGFDLDTRLNTADATFLNNTFHNVGVGPGLTTDTCILVEGNADDIDLTMINNLCHSPNNSIENQPSPPTWNSSTNKNILSDAQATALSMPGAFIESATFQAGSGGSGTRVMLNNISVGEEDFRLVDDDDNAAIGFGENLSTLAVTLPSNIHLDVAINGLARSTISAWDAGADALRITSTVRTVSASRRRMMTMQTAVVGPTDIIEVTGLPAEFPHNFLSAQFYDASGAQIIPTSGTILLEIETVSGSPNFELMLDGVIEAADPSTLTWAANTHSLRATPTGLDVGGVHSWRMVATFNRT
jgi:hypothetical protein